MKLALPSLSPRRRWLLLFAGISFCYLYFVPYFPYLSNPVENARIYQIRALVELHKLSIDEMTKRYGWVNDLAKANGKLYPNKAPGTTFLGAVIYEVHRGVRRLFVQSAISPFEITYVLRLWGAIFPALLFVFLYRRFLLRFIDDEAIADLLSATLALGTMFLPYALQYGNHTLSAAASFGTVIATHAALDAQAHTDPRARRTRWLWFGVAGFLLSFAASLDYALFPVGVFLLVYVVARAGWSRASAVGTCLGASIPAFLTALYHQLCWGSPFRVSMDRLTNPKYAGFAKRGFYGIIGPTMDSLSGVLVSRRGLFTFMPIFAIALVATLVALRSRRFRKEAILACAVTWWMLLYTLSLVNWYGGWQLGPRYMAASCPFAIFALALAWSELGAATRRVALPLVGGLAIVSILFVGLTSVLFPHPAPHFTNPFFELTVPLWLQGITPYSLGWFLFHWRDRVDQIPLLLVGGAIVVYLVWQCAGRWLQPTPKRFASIAMLAATLIVLGTTWRLWAIPRSDLRVRTDANAWVRNMLWEPPLSNKKPPPAPPAKVETEPNRDREP